MAALGYTWWRNLYTSMTGAGSRPKGLQSSIPLAYTQPAASCVTLDTAFQVSAVWAACRLITESVAGMPIYLYDIDKNGVKTRNFDHPIAKLFTGKINQWQTRGEFMETMTMQQSMQGNCYALIQRNGQKEIIGLMPFMTQDMEVALTAEDGSIMYRYMPNTANAQIYTSDRILHVKCMGNGIVGLSPLGYARNSIGIAQAAENAVTKVYSNGAKPSGLLTIDKVLSDTQRAAVKQNFIELESGTQDRLFVLEAGMQYQQVSMTPQDIELLATRRFQIEDIARFFGVPSVMINDTTASTVWGSGIQQIIEGFYKLGIRPYLRRYQEAFEAALLTPEERISLKIEFDFQDFLRPDQAERIKSYGEAVSKGIMTPNEARAMEGWTALDGGNQAFMQQQMIPLDMLGKVATQAKIDEMKSAAENKQSNTYNINVPEVKMPQPIINVDAPVVHIDSPHIHVKQPAITIENQPAIVNVTNDVKASDVIMPAPVVNVAAPNVKVDAAQITVTPSVNVKLPRRKTQTTVKYDSQDRISSSTQVEEDA